ncbi:MAG: hypothetical protein ACU85U_15905 [Gammaproteobacteria bacterium]
MSLVARQLEANGIATVIMGSAKDIVEYCGVPRFVYTDYPLGNPCGRPYDDDSKRIIMDAALSELRDATVPGVTVQTDLHWDDSDEWKSNFLRVGPDNIDALRAAGDARRADQAAVRARMLAARREAG